MTVQTFWDSQLTGEIKPYTTDVTAFLPDGVTVQSGSASYSQTFGGSAAGSAPVSVAGSSVTMTTPALSVVGEYEFVKTFTLTNGNVRKVLYKISVPK